MADNKKPKSRSDMSRKELANGCRNLGRRNKNMLDVIDTILPDEGLSKEGRMIKKKMIRPTVLSTVGMLSHVAEILDSEKGGQNGSSSN